MKLKVFTAKIIAASTCALLALTAFADTKNDYLDTDDQQQKVYFNCIKGTVKEISDYKDIEGAEFINIESEDGQTANIIVDDDTYVERESEIKEGSDITAFYDANKPVIMIYPPQYMAEVVVVDSENQDVKVDLFNKELISSDNMLKLNITDETEIISKDGTKFDGELADKKLAIFYGVSTKSIPAQTSPDKVVVLSQEEAEQESEPSAADVSSMDIIVNGKNIETLPAFAYEDGTVMVPVRSISEALGCEVGWDNQQQRVAVGQDVNFRIGDSVYTSGEAGSVEFRNVPVLKDETTYVPLEFFSDILNVREASVSGSQILINSETTENNI